MNFRGTKRKRYIGDINVTPLLDMMFILLIFLMISTTFKTPERAFDIKLPTAGNEEVTIMKGIPTVIVTAKGEYYFVDPENSSSPQKIDKEKLYTVFQHLAKEDPKQPVSIRGAKDATIQSLIDVVSAAYKAGLTHVMLPYEVGTK